MILRVYASLRCETNINMKKYAPVLNSTAQIISRCSSRGLDNPLLHFDDTIAAIYAPIPASIAAEKTSIKDIKPHAYTVEACGVRL